MATHKFIDADRSVVDKIEDAKGIRYILADDGTGPYFDYVITDEARDMLAAFGAKTLATNTVSGFYDAAPAKGKPRPRKADAPTDDLTGLGERFSAIVAGEWGAERGGGGGVGYNLEDLLEALDSTMAAIGKPINREKVAKNLVDGGVFKGATLDAKAYRKAIYNVEGVRAAYDALRAAKVPTTAATEVADDFS